MENFKK